MVGPPGATGTPSPGLGRGITGIFVPGPGVTGPQMCIRDRARVVSYPMNPVCTAAPVSFYEKLVAFAKKYQIMIIHDNAYSELVYDLSLIHIYSFRSSITIHLKLSPLRIGVSF